MKKTVQVIGHSFSCCPGHVVIEGRGSGSSLRVALCNAVRAMLKDERLRHRHINNFKLSVVVIADKKVGGS